ncbi:MAG TPA: anaerobic carbon-monoxide dehydrogenase catalytic subunit [Anaerolineae bacterium]|nr:anaerobic carbon-monoxide dehydrogenase catalytic subunit [Anaerolineae bacterium]HPL28589.1 anaerobic carbon-monoxide dehydrogenase catalytic subunit [Anaerolineae bacterium]
MTMQDRAAKRSLDPATQQMLRLAAERGYETTWERLEAQQPQCGYGELGVCCRHCTMGPCRIDPFGDSGPQKGVCGATADTIVARGLLRMIAAGAAAHSDHGRDIAHTLLLTAQGKGGGYEIKDEAKLHALAAEYGIATEGRTKEDIALDLARAAYAEFGNQEGPILFTRRAPAKRVALWQTLGIEPRGVDREIVESMHRTHIGVDNDPVNLILHGLRTSIADGWGGSMIATELSDVLFGTPRPVQSQANLGVLKDDQVNIILHGHEPTLSEMIVAAAQDAEMLALAQQQGAAGINVAGMCCTGNEILMRHGIPVAGNFLQQELALITGAVEAMIVDVQCVFPALPELAACFHTKIISTSPKAKFPGATHIEFHEERAYEIAKGIVREAVLNYANRKAALVNIPRDKTECMVGFSVEAIVAALGGTLDPLLGAVKSGAIRGIAGVVGCNNPKVRHDYGHITLVKELIKNDVLVVNTGCNAIACAKAGLLQPEAAELAGAGLQGVCRALGIPPVLHMGSCVDISRILVACAAIANALGVDISDLPVAGAAPEWMSEKAVSIGAYVVSSGIYTVLGVAPPVLGGPAVTQLLTAGAEGVVGAMFAVEPDPEKAAALILQHIQKKRAALGLG